MSALRPKFIQNDPADNERYGAAAGIVIGHIRYRCTSDGPGRSVINGVRWWRVSVADLAAEVGLSVQVVRTALKTLAGVVVGQHLSEDGDRTLAYRIADDQPFVSSNKSQEDGGAICCQQQTHLLAATNAPLIETLETKKEPLRGSKEAAETPSTPADSNTSDPGSDLPTTQGDGLVKHDPNQDGLPGMHLLPLPTNDTPVPATEQVPKRGTRLPENWMPPLDVVAQMRAECPNVDQAAELLKFRDYWCEKVGKDATKLTWKGTYRNWIRKAASDYRRNGNGHNGLSAVDEKALGWQGIGR